MWGTIVNFIAVVLGGVLGTLIKVGFSRKILMAGLAVILGLTIAAVILLGSVNQDLLPTILLIGAGASTLWWILGICLRRGLPENVSRIIMQGVGLSVIVIGMMSALKTDNILLVIMSLIVGGIVGEWIGIEEKLDSVGKWAQRRIGKSRNSTFSEGFVTASLIFCVGAMAIVGSLEGGLEHRYETLYAKSTLDGVTSMVLASTLGFGVVFSAFAVLLYQGSITLTAGMLKPYLSQAVVNEMSAVGGILIIGIGLSMLDIKKFNVGNMLPAIFVPLLYFPIAQLVAALIVALK